MAAPCCGPQETRSVQPHPAVRHALTPLALACLAALAQAQQPTSPAPAEPVAGTTGNSRNAGIVTVTGGRPSSLPTQIPTTIESILGSEVETKINATDAEDALKYFPSLLVRKRYIGDYNHAVLSSRASGTGNSARSMVYADGILLSNYLGNGAAFTPRWGLVTPEEIDRVDVLYGPFSAAYPGNSVGAVVDYVTRMPQKFEAHAKVGAFGQRFKLYGTNDTFTGWQASASVGDRAGAFSWWVNVNRLKNEGQPQTFATKSVSATTGAAGTPVTGAVLDTDRFGNPWYLIGDATRYDTTQDHAKIKLAYDFGGSVRAQYTLGGWRNSTEGQSVPYLKRSDGTPFYSGVATIDGRNYTVAATDFNQTRDALTHLMHGLSVASRTRGVFDWEIAASLYDYDKDTSRTPTVAKPAADSGGAGRITSLAGTGWNTLALKGVWRPNAEHLADFGVQQDRYRWRQRIDNAADWITGDPTTPVSSFRGETALRSVYAQDAWSFAPGWKAVLGARYERWTARDGAKTTGTAAPVRFTDRSESWVSPKAALGWQASDALALKLSTGRAIRVPTVGELFQGNAGTDLVTNPGLLPEKSWTTELSAEFTLAGTQRLRTTLFHENTTDALYSQAIPGTTPIVNSVQNIDRIRTLGLETAYDAPDLFVKGLDLQASLTYADSTIKTNRSFVATPGDTIGRQQPRVPKWRASLLVSYKLTDELSGSLGARYGSRQYGNLNNADTNGFAYQGFSSYLTADLRLRWKIDKQWSAAFGIDNLNNQTYWNFHPYPQRTYVAELRFDL
jgi:iron complex outermembrane receptor protein